MRVRSRVVISPLFLAGLLSCVGATETPATSEAPDEDDGTSTSGTTDDSNSASSSSTTTPTTDSTTGPEASTATSSTGDETIGSSTSGTALECGDGVVDPETEECDDGPENSDHGACTGQCVLNVCGDGLLHDGVEECDLGPANNDGAQCGGCMSETCTLGPHCGDGHVDVACGELYIVDVIVRLRHCALLFSCLRGYRASARKASAGDQCKTGKNEACGKFSARCHGVLPERMSKD